MSFARRRKNTVEATSLAQLTAKEAEAKIIAGVKRFAINQDVWQEANGNTPFLGQTIGMGIESANMVDVTMTIEKLFLTEKNGSPEKLMINDGEDTFAATPGLAVKMLMEGGHLKSDDEYLHEIVSFANIVVIGEGYRLDQQAQRGYEQWQQESDAATKSHLKEKVVAVVDEIGEFIEISADSERLTASRASRLQEEQAIHDELKAKIVDLEARIATAETAGDETATNELRGQVGPLKVRFNKAEMALRIAKRVAAETSQRKPVEENAFAVLQAKLAATVADIRTNLG